MNIACFPLPAQAYMDPGTGSYLLQILLAGFLGAGFAVRMFWGRIKTLFSRKDKPVKPDGQDDPSP
jgi:hypothetical protein